VWGREFTEDEIMLMGERIWNLGRLFNLREGVAPDSMPRKLYAAEHALADGPSGGKAIGEEAFWDVLQEYYRLRGWDENGVPTEARLAEVGVDVRL
jgi:aldehyde:ferredoxin oxidoreductase